MLGQGRDAHMILLSWSSCCLQKISHASHLRTGWKLFKDSFWSEEVVFKCAPRAEKYMPFGPQWGLLIYYKTTASEKYFYILLPDVVLFWDDLVFVKSNENNWGILLIFWWNSDRG